MSVFSKIASIFTPRKTESEYSEPRTLNRKSLLIGDKNPKNYNSSVLYDGNKYGEIEYYNRYGINYVRMRKNSRGIYRESLIARNIVSRLVDTVINTGIQWESSPKWDFLNIEKNDDEKYKWEQGVEHEWEMYTESTESDIENIKTFSQIQRIAYRKYVIDGECIAILRYLNSPNRLNPVAIQIIDSDQLANPADIETIENAGGSVKHGIEKNATGQITAIWVRDKKANAGFSFNDSKRIPIFGPRSGRRFVVYMRNEDEAGQSRGMPELAPLVYELKTLTDYDIAELEAVVSQAIWAASIETHENSPDQKKPTINPNIGKAKIETNNIRGVQQIKEGKFALYQMELKPGQKMNFHSPNRPNQNFVAFHEEFTTRIANSLGMPLSVVKQAFNSSYSAARAEILFYWLTVSKRRSDFIDGFISPVHKAWFHESVKMQTIKAPGFEKTKRNMLAWGHGTWAGIARPTVDPDKEGKAIERRILMGHSTNERESKLYNGSDYRENIERLKKENELKRMAFKSAVENESDQENITEENKDVSE